MRGRLILALVILLAAVPAHGVTITVSPGPGTPLQDAIDAAPAGARIRVQPGVYPETIIVSKKLRIRGKDATVAAGCGSATAVDVIADDVKLQSLTVTGGSFYTVNVQGRTKVAVTNLFVESACPGAQYGINVFNSTEVQVKGNLSVAGLGYGDAFIYIGGIPANARVKVRANTIRGVAHVRGIILEDTSDAPGGGPAITTQRNVILGTTQVGIFLHNSDDLEVVRNVIDGSDGPGIHADATSDNNVIKRNFLSGNNPDVLDDGTGNCWKDNDFVTGTVAPCS